MEQVVALNQNRDFKRLYSHGKSIVGRLVVVYYRQGPTRQNRLGITVSKKIGKAVVRSRIRRLVREAYRLEQHRLPVGLDMVIVARGRAAKAKCQDVRRELVSLWEKEGIGLL